MARRSRSTLKHFFRKGALPSASDFADLVDSTVNQEDDGFDKTPENGLEISSLGTEEALMSFLRRSRSTAVLWMVSYDQDRDRLLFKRMGPSRSTHTVLSLRLDDMLPQNNPRGFEGRVGVNRRDPEHALDVDGVVRASGRIGVPLEGSAVVKADGGWHAITQTLSGCQAFEVIAGVGAEKTGRYAMLHATAMNTYNPTGPLFNFLGHKNRIRAQHAHYSGRSHRLQLRWAQHGDRTEYRLELRSCCDYGQNLDGRTVGIRYYVTRLWLDAAMESCVMPEGSED